MSPRLMSISSSSVSVTDIGAKAKSRSPSKVTMRLTRAERPDGHAVTRSPTRTVPDDDLSGVAAELVVRPQHELHGEAERRATSASRVDLDRLEVLEQAAGRRTTACGRCA